MVVDVAINKRVLRCSPLLRFLATFFVVNHRYMAPEKASRWRHGLAALAAGPGVLCFAVRLREEVDSQELAAAACCFLLLLLLLLLLLQLLCVVARIALRTKRAARSDTPSRYPFMLSPRT